MRVISGKAKGRALYMVPGQGTRPITDRAKTALFDILSHYVIGSRFLDLFAGTGQVGIEALSRGAREAVFVEWNRPALRTIRGNLEHTGLTEGAVVVDANVFEYLRQEPEPFDFIFIAPPQYEELWIETLMELDIQPGWLQEDGWAIVQIDPAEYQDLELQNLVRFDQRTYGGVMFCFYARRDLVEDEVDDPEGEA
jgi:16S rRNA (guanine(966)-N(2))-methyltransferase RsmD